MAKQIHGEEYMVKVQSFIETIQYLQKLKGKTVMAAVYEICTYPIVKEDGLAIIMFMAAAVEIIEPSNVLI